MHLIFLNIASKNPPKAPNPCYYLLMIYAIFQSLSLAMTAPTGPVLLELRNNPALPWMIATAFLVVAVLLLLMRLAAMYKAREEMITHLTSSDHDYLKNDLTEIFESLLASSLTLERDPAALARFKTAFTALDPVVQAELARVFPALATYLSELITRLGIERRVQLALNETEQGAILEVELPQGGVATPDEQISAAEQLALDELHESLRESASERRGAYYEEAQAGHRSYCLKIYK